LGAAVFFVGVFFDFGLTAAGFFALAGDFFGFTAIFGFLGATAFFAFFDAGSPVASFFVAGSFYSSSVFRRL